MESIVKGKVKIYSTAITAIVLLILGIIISVSVGVADVDLLMVLKSFFETNPSKDQLIIQTLRLPRAIIGALVGANLAVAGALMQAITRNSLASPQVFGVNAGASLFIVTAFALFPSLFPIACFLCFYRGSNRRNNSLFLCFRRGNDSCKTGVSRNGRTFSFVLFNSRNHYF